MNYDKYKHHRQSIRLKGYDYTEAGAYFVTICTQDREGLFGDVVDWEMRLNDEGTMVRDVWYKIPEHFPHADIDEFVVMPNHVHGIIMLSGRGDPCDRPVLCVDNDHLSDEHIQGDHKDRPYNMRNIGRPRGTLPGSVGRIVQAFKSLTTHEYIRGIRGNGWHSFNGKLWQRNYYEHIIRSEEEMNRIREYIIANPAQWAEDEDNPENIIPHKGGSLTAPTDITHENSRI